MEKTESAFVITFGNSARIKVLDFLLTFNEFDYSKTQVADEISISRVTINSIWKELIKENIIISTRKIGCAHLYILNKKNPLVQVLLELTHNLAKELFIEEEISIKMKNK